MGFTANLKKDLKMMISGKFFLLVLGSLIIYSLYISLIYVNQDMEELTIYLYDPLNTAERESENIIRVDTKAVLKEKILDTKEAVAVDKSEEVPQITVCDTGNKLRNQINADYALQVIDKNTVSYSSLDLYNRKEKLKREMTCEVIFFEIVFVGFIGIASLVFKERQMGVLKVYNILPAKIHSFIFSKISLFLLSDLLFCSVLIGINLGVNAIFEIVPRIFLHIAFLSGIMALCGNICALIYKDFKQFGLSYAFIIILLTSPVYLAANTVITWKWIEYYLPYRMYMAIKEGFFGGIKLEAGYIIICILLFIILYYFEIRAMKRVSGKE